nr:23S rRNA (uracil(1939)-C(5))-methyltransferase RlmD [Clostridia bacterium]
IDRLGDEAQGIALHEGMVVFVPKALPGERARVRVIKPDKRYAVARLLEVEKASPERVEPPCPYAARCGGCVSQHMRYEATLEFKQRQVEDCLCRIGGLEAPDVAPMLGMENPWRYRNKGSFPVGGTVGAPFIGCYAPRSHTIVDAPEGCLLQDEQSDRMVSAVRRWMIEQRIPPYEEAEHRGLIRHAVTRVTRAGQAMLTLVTMREDIPAAKALTDALRAAAPGLRGVCIAPNDQRTNVIFGDTSFALWGNHILEETHFGLRFSLSPRAFFQVNPVQADKLYHKALEYAQLRGDERVADVYCGTGTMTLLLARQAREVVGIEWSEAAVADAERNAAYNGIPNARFVCEDAAKALPALAEAGERLDVVVLDPPRKGCDEAVLQAVGRARPKRLVYVSCNPATLARDAALLAGLGYGLQSAQPVDMFCWTGSVETAALFLPLPPKAP